MSKTATKKKSVGVPAKKRSVSGSSSPKTAERPPTTSRKKPSLMDEIHARLRTLEEDNVKHATKARRLNERINTQGAAKNHAFLKVWERLTALESRLPAPATQQEKWVPCVDDLVVVRGFEDRGACRVHDIERNSGEVYYVLGDKGARGKWIAESIRPATPAEVQAHQQAEKKRKEEEQDAKLLVFGARVLVDMEQWRLACDGPDKNDLYYVIRSVENGVSGTFVARSEFTIITPEK